MFCFCFVFRKRFLSTKNLSDALNHSTRRELINFFAVIFNEKYIYVMSIRSKRVKMTLFAGGPTATHLRATAPYETVQKRSIQSLKHTKTQPTTIAAYKIAWLGSRQSVQRRSIQNRITQKDVNKMGYQIESVSYKIVSYKVTLSKTH